MVVPTRNRRELLACTLHTVCGQQDVDLEVLVVDDGSDSCAAAEVVAARQDPRVRILRNPAPRGVSATRNRGLEAAAGRWVAFCDDDDLWAPDKLAEQLAAADRSGRDWVYAGAVKIDTALRVVGGEPPQPPDVVHRRLPRWTLVPGGCSGVVARRELVLAVGGFDSALVNLADWDLWSRLARHGPPAWVPLPLVGYRIHAGNSSQDTRLVLRELELIDGRYGGRVDRAAVHHYLAWVSLRGGRRRQAAAHFVQAAVRGDALGVGRSLSALARGRLRRRRPQAPHAAWRALADRWLEPLR